MGAFLVAIPDPDSPSFPAGTRGFSPIPLRPFPFPSLVVASSDDPFGSPAYAQRCASVWGSEYIVIGQAGHINADSGHGEWMEGQRLFQTFQASRLRRGE
jgi:predicted alpha/beta hydrolase family esterase